MRGAQQCLAGSCFLLYFVCVSLSLRKALPNYLAPARLFTSALHNTLRNVKPPAGAFSCLRRDAPCLRVPACAQRTGRRGRQAFYHADSWYIFEWLNCKRG
jgi:hypothetical protein